MKLFKSKTLLEHEQNFAAFFPPGSAFANVQNPDSNLGSLLTGLANELKRAYDDINNISEDYDILFTEELLSRWESAVGIPDSVFPGNGSEATRRLHVLLKFAKMNVQTAPEMVELGIALGFTDISITPLNQNPYPPYMVPFFPGSLPGSRYVIVVLAGKAVNGIPPYDVPFTPTASNTSLLNLILNVVKPTNVEVIFGNI